MEIIHKIGRRKTAVARVYLSEGKGNIVIKNKKNSNYKDVKEYFTTSTLQYKVNQPLMLTDNEKTFDIKVSVFGGGITGQAEASACPVIPPPKTLTLISNVFSLSVNIKGWFTLYCKVDVVKYSLTSL